MHGKIYRDRIPYLPMITKDFQDLSAAKVSGQSADQTVNSLQFCGVIGAAVQGMIAINNKVRSGLDNHINFTFIFQGSV